MNDLQKMWVTAYQQYIDGCKDPGRLGKSPSPVVLGAAREHADRVLASLNKLQTEVTDG